MIIVIISTHSKDKNTAINNETTNPYLQQIQEEVNSLLKKFPKDSNKKVGKYLFIDTETTGLPLKRSAEPENFENWPYIIEIAWYLIDEDGLMVDGAHYIVKQNVKIPKAASDIHHITTEKMRSKGESPKTVYAELVDAIGKTEYIIAHNIDFDFPIIECELLRNGFPKMLSNKKSFCTMKKGKLFCKVYDKNMRVKNPTLSELFGELYFDNPYLKIEAHNALTDTQILYRCFMKMIELRPDILKKNENPNKKNITGDNFKEIVNLSPIIPHDHLSGDILKKDLSNADPQSPFYNKKVVITGVFPIERYELALILKNKMGADIDSNVSKTTKILLMGDEPGPAKVAKALEADIEIYDVEKTMKTIEPYR